jgi:hypothetical protein
MTESLPVFGIRNKVNVMGFPHSQDSCFLGIPTQRNHLIVELCLAAGVPPIKKFLRSQPIGRSRVPAYSRQESDGSGAAAE